MRWKCGKVQVHFWNASNSIHFRFVFTAIQTRFKKVIWTFNISTHTLHTLFGTMSEMLCVCVWAQARIPCLYAILHRSTLVTLNQFHGAVLLCWLCACALPSLLHIGIIVITIIFGSFTFGFILQSSLCSLIAGKKTRPTKTTSNNIIQLSFLNACSLPQARKMERLVKTCRLLFVPRVQLSKSYACSLFLYVQVFPQK